MIAGCVAVQLALMPNGTLRAFSTFLKLSGAAYRRSRRYHIDDDDFETLKDDVKHRHEASKTSTARTLHADQLNRRVDEVDAAMAGTTAADARRLADERRAGAARHGQRWLSRACVKIAALSPLSGEPILCGGAFSTKGRQPRGTRAVPSRSFLERLSRSFVVLLVNEYLSSQRCPQVCLCAHLLVHVARFHKRLHRSAQQNCATRK